MNKLSIYAGLMILSVSSAGVLHAAPVKADADGNRTVTKAEAIAAADARFAKIDVNGDGTLNAADRTAMMAKRFAIIDTNSDGSISQSEFMANMKQAQTDEQTNAKSEWNALGRACVKAANLAVWAPWS